MKKKNQTSKKRKKNTASRSDFFSTKVSTKTEIKFMKEKKESNKQKVRK